MYISSDSCQIPNLGFMLEKFLGAKRDGFFVDVGAHDGYSWSNVWGLAEVGWSGLCYEPDITLAANCRRNHAASKHNGVYTIEAAIGAVDGWTDLWIADNDLPTTDIETVNKLLPHHQYRNSGVKVHTLKLDTTLVEWSVPIGFDLLSLDVEGGEWDCLKGLTLERWRPKMAIIEMHRRGSLEPGRGLHNTEIEAYFTNGGYVSVYYDDLNNIFTLR